MRRIIVGLCILLVFSVMLSYLFSEEPTGWTKISPRTLPEERAKEISLHAMQFVSDGILVGYTDIRSNPFVLEYTPFRGRWDYVGENIITEAKAEDIFVAYDYEREGNDRYFAAFMDWGNDKKASLMVCDEGDKTWKPFTPAFTPQRADDFVMIYTSGGFQSAYLDPDRRPRIFQYNRDEWYELKMNENDHPSEDRASELTICDSRYAGLMAYADRKYSDKATVMILDDHWIPVGNKGFSDGRISYLKMAHQYSRQSKRERIWVAYQDYAHDKKLTVMYNENLGDTWLPLGAKGFTAGSPQSIDIAIYKMVPFVAFADGAYDRAATVMYYYKDEWHVAGKPGFSEEGVTDIEIEINGDTAYVAYITTDSSKHIEVQKIDISGYFK